MKIAICVHQFFPEYGAGTEVLTLRTATELRNRGHEVVIYTGFFQRRGIHLDEANSIDEYEYQDFRVRRILNVPVHMRGITRHPDLDDENKFFALFLADELRREKFDLVHFFHMYRLGTESIDACKQAGVPVVLAPTDFWAACPLGQLVLPDSSICEGPGTPPVNCLRHCLEGRFGKEYESRLGMLTDSDYADVLLQSNKPKGSKSLRKVTDDELRQELIELARTLVDRQPRMRKRFERADKVIVPSKVIGTVLSKNGFDASNHTELGFGLDLSELKISSNRGCLPQLRVGFIGSMIPTKGVHVLAKALTNLSPSIAIDLKMYGKTSENPNYFEVLQNIVGKDSRASFPGTFPAENIWSIFEDLDCLVIPSTWYENTPLVLLSAQAAKCPVVATNLEGMSEVIEHGRNGLLFPSGDDIALSECLLRLYEDRELLKRLSVNARPQKSMAEYVDELEKIYRSVTPVGLATK